MNTLELLENAINEQKTISFDYKWEWVRIWNPHTIFAHSSTWNVLIDIFQIDGYSTDNETIPWWKQFSLTKITNINISDSTFIIAEWYVSNSPKYEKVICKIK
jgi:predicted DNA-binding transcriptional regulator YafY